MTTNDEGEIAQSERGRLRALAQKRRVTRAERREIMFDLVVAGYSRELIAQKLCVSLETVRREVEKAIDQRRLDAPDRYVRLQVTRLTRRCAWSIAPSKRATSKRSSPWSRSSARSTAITRWRRREVRRRQSRAAFPAPSRRSR